MSRKMRTETLNNADTNTYLGAHSPAQQPDSPDAGCWCNPAIGRLFQAAFSTLPLSVYLFENQRATMTPSQMPTYMMKMARYPNLHLVLSGKNIKKRAAVSLSMASVSCLQSYFAGPSHCIIDLTERKTIVFKVTPQEQTLLSNVVIVLPIRHHLKLCGGETWGEASDANSVRCFQIPSLETLLTSNCCRLFCAIVVF